MYSAEAIQLYGELLKTASEMVEVQFSKEAGVADWGRRLLGLHGVEQAGERMLTNPAVRETLSGVGAAAKAAKRAPGDAIANMERMLAVKPYLPAEAASTAAGAATPQRLLSPAQIAGGAALGLGAGAAGYGLGQHNQAKADKTKRNLAFGAGAAAGLALPGVLRGAANAAQGASLAPANMFGGY